jgi:hypothetical protein
MLATRDLLSQTFYRSEGFAKFAGKGICLELPLTKKSPAFFTGLRFTFPASFAVISIFLPLPVKTHIDRVRD